MGDDAFDELREGLRGATLDDVDPGSSGIWRIALGSAAAVLIGLGVFLVVTARPPTTSQGVRALVDPAIDVVDEPAVSTTADAGVARVWPAEPIDVVGNVVRSGPHRWSVGEPGDLVTIGDWDCDGSPTPAVLRPTTGRLHVFDAWATEATALTAAPGPTVPPGATAVESSGCGRATVRTADGRVVELETADAP